MDFLILAHGYFGSLVDQDVRSHEHRIKQQPEARRPALPFLLLISWHTFQPRNRGQAAQHPRQLQVFWHIRLDNQSHLLRVQPRRQVVHRYGQLALRHLRRIVGYREGMVVYHSEDAVISVLQGQHTLHSPQVVAQMHAFSRGLNTGENPLPAHLSPPRTVCLSSVIDSPHNRKLPPQGTGVTWTRAVPPSLGNPQKKNLP